MESVGGLWAIPVWTILKVLAACAVIGSIPLVGLWFYARLTSRKAKRQWRGVDYGVTLVEGLPGTGKSFELVRVAVQAAKSGRLVYTNLPLRPRVVRQYMRLVGRGSMRRRERMIQPLTEEFFRTFLRRQAAESALREQHKGLRSAEMMRVIEAALGPRRIGVDWIPATSMVILDEAHNWFPMQTQAGETLDLLRYLAMHRHHLHRVFVATQDVIFINKRFRDIAETVWVMRNRSREPIVFGITAGMLGVDVLAVCEYTAAAFEAGTGMRKPYASRNVWYLAPWHRWRFRLYDSFTHQGGRRRLQRAADAAVAEVMKAVGDEHLESGVVLERSESAMWKWACLIGLVGVVGFLSWAYVVGGRVHAELTAKAAAAASAPPASAVGVASVDLSPGVFPKVRLASFSEVRFDDGSVWQRGRERGGFIFLLFDGRSVYVGRDEGGGSVVYALAPGGGVASRVCTGAEFIEMVRRASPEREGSDQ